MRLKAALRRHAFLAEGQRPKASGRRPHAEGRRPHTVRGSAADKWPAPARPLVPHCPPGPVCRASLLHSPVLRFPSLDSPRSLPCLSCAFLLSTLPAHCLPARCLIWAAATQMPCRRPMPQLQAVSLAAIAAAGCVPRRHRSYRLCPSQPSLTPYDRRTTAVSSFGGDTGGQPRLWPKTAQPSPCSRPVAHSPPSTPRPPLPSTLSLASASKVDLSTPPIRSTHPPALSSIRPLAPSTTKASLILVSQELQQRWPPCRSPLQLLNSLICR